MADHAPAVPYWTAVRSHWVGLIVTWFGWTSLIWGTTAINLLKWPRWAILFGLAFGVMFAQYRAWRDTDNLRVEAVTALDAALAEPPPDAPTQHVTDLRSVADSITNAIRVGQQAGRSDPRTRALLAHLPDLESPLDRWIAGMRAMEEAHYAYRKRIERELSDAGIVEAPFRRSAIEVHIRDAALDAVRKDPEKEWHLRLSWTESEPSWGVLVAVPGGPTLIDGTDTVEERTACITSLQHAFQACESSAEVRAIPAAEEALKQLQAELATVFDQVRHRYDASLLRLSADCPLCGSAA